MFGSEPYLRDSGLVPGFVGDRDASLHLYRRNSCQQERLHQDLHRLQQQEDSVLRRANREIIDLTLEQKHRREILKKPRRRSETLGVRAELGTVDTGCIISNRRRLYSGSSSNIGTTPSRRASVSSSSAVSLSATQSRLTDRPKSQSFERLHRYGSTDSSSLSSGVHETFVDFKSQQDVTRLKKFSERWQKAVDPSKRQRTGKPLIPTNSFTSSPAQIDRKMPKTPQVFDRLSMETKASSMPSDQFLKMLRNKQKPHESGQV